MRTARWPITVKKLRKNALATKTGKSKLKDTDLKTKTLTKTKEERQSVTIRKIKREIAIVHGRSQRSKIVY